MHGIKEIIHEAKTLTIEERVLVVDSLLRTINPVNNDIEKEWAAVANQRLEELRSGKVKAIPGNQVFAEVQKRFGR